MSIQQYLVRSKSSDGRALRKKREEERWLPSQMASIDDREQTWRWFGNVPGNNAMHPSVGPYKWTVCRGDSFPVPTVVASLTWFILFSR
jgi:hypothetical protein